MNFVKRFYFFQGLPIGVSKLGKGRIRVDKEPAPSEAKPNALLLTDTEERVTAEGSDTSDSALLHDDLNQPELLAEPVLVVTRPDFFAEPADLVYEPISMDDSTGNRGSFPTLPTNPELKTADTLTTTPERESCAWVSNAAIAKFTTSGFLARLALSDTDLLNSLPYRITTGCPHCTNQSLVERKTQTDEGKHYCSVCKKRVWASPVPYYYESKTSNPPVAISRHRKYLTEKCSEKIDALRRQERLHVSPYLKGKAYFISIDSVDEAAYTALANKYDAYYTDHVGLEPTTKLQIQLCSTGGSVFQAKRLISLINANQAITHVQATVLYSAAFYIYFNLTCSKELDADAVGMYHLSRSCHYVLQNGKVLDHYPDPVEEGKTLFINQIGLTQEEIDLIMTGVDVYFNRQRLLELTQSVFPSVAKPINRFLQNLGVNGRSIPDSADKL